MGKQFSMKKGRWGAALREAHKGHGSPCAICGAPSEFALMVGLPTPAGLEYQGMVRACDACKDKVLNGELPDSFTLLQQQEKKEEETNA